MDKGGPTVPGACHLNIVLTDPASRQGDWVAVRQCVQHVSRAWSVYVHCVDGVRFAPCLAAVSVAHVQGCSFDAALQHLRQVQGIEPERVVDQDKDGELFKWLRCIADSHAAPPLSGTLPLKLLTSVCGRSAIHALAAGASVGEPQPACRWRQARDRRRSTCKNEGGVVWIADLFEGVALDRPWCRCRACVAMLPAGVQSSLKGDHTIELR